MTDLTPLEQKRAEASKYRGVSYDARMGKFVAMITINGEKKYLGSFLTAEDASFAYDTERAAHRVERKRTSGAKSLRQLMAEFAENAVYDGGRYNNAVAGQIFTAPDGQRFRLERFKALRGKGWYLWSAPCRFCGALFEQETSLKLRTISGMARNCDKHHKQIHKDVDAPDVWPDPVAWTYPPVRQVNTSQKIQIARTKKPEVHNERTFEKYLDSVWSQLENDKKLEEKFNKLQNETLSAFFTDHAFRFPESDYEEKYAAWMSQNPEPFAELLKEKQSLVSFAGPVNARYEDAIALAEHTTEEKPNNEDLA